jgi:hypothetical protein
VAEEVAMVVDEAVLVQEVQGVLVEEEVEKVVEQDAWVEE